jgi:hypothetical protein
MPSSSKKQHNFMAAIANNPAFATKVGVPQSVGKDFSNADKGKTFKQGGDMATMNPGFMAMMAKKKDGMHKMPDGKMMKDSAMKKMNMGGMAEGGMSDKTQDKAMIKKAFKQHDMQEHKGGTGTSLKLANGGVDPRVSALMAARPSGPRPQMPAGMRTPMPAAARPPMGKPRPPMGTAPMPAPMKKGGITKMASGGYTRAADGIAQRGKTEARKVTMNRGGKC